MTHCDVIVIGGGQAGLTIGRLLSEQGRHFLILEAAEGPGAAWRARWDSLRLFTPAQYDSLPGRPFPAPRDHHPGRDDVVAYLTDYARDLPVRYGGRVEALRRTSSGYELRLADRTLTADQVVVATGPFQVPRVPGLSRDVDPRVRQLHSADYRNPDQIPAGPVLVVGGGNTGYQIAEELSVAHEVHLAVGSRQTPLPQRLLGRDVFDFLIAVGALRTTAKSRLGRRLKGRDTLIGSSPRRARRLGIRLHVRAVGARGGSVTFADGGSVSPTTIIWATGFAVDHSWIDAPVFDTDHRLVHERGVTAAPGLYFLGLPWLHTRASALLGWVKDDAEHLAALIRAF